MEPVKLHCVSSEDDLLEVKTFVSLGCPNLQLKLYTSRTHPWINFNQVSAKNLKKLIDQKEQFEVDYQNPGYDEVIAYSGWNAVDLAAYTQTLEDIRTGNY